MLIVIEREKEKMWKKSKYIIMTHLNTLLIQSWGGVTTSSLFLRVRARALGFDLSEEVERSLREQKPPRIAVYIGPCSSLWIWWP